MFLVVVYLAPDPGQDEETSYSVKQFDTFEEADKSGDNDCLSLSTCEIDCCYVIYEIAKISKTSKKYDA